MDMVIILFIIVLVYIASNIILLIIIVYIKWRQRTKNVLLVSIEGNIGSGKSTLINILKNSIPCVIVEEPIKQWINMGIFKLYCKDPIRYSYLFQSTVLWTRMIKITEGIREARLKGINTVIVERSGIADYLCFIRTMLDLKQLSPIEYNSIEMLYEYILDKYNIFNGCKFIYLNTSPEVCKKRIIKRNRDGEKKSISLDYLKMLDNRHRQDLIEYIGSNNILNIDGDNEYIFDDMNLNRVLEKIKKFINFNNRL